MTAQSPAAGTLLSRANDLTDWANAENPKVDSNPKGLRFAFYGRVSTEDHQDPETSRAWQRLRTDAVASGHGRIVAEFFDVSHSRSLP